MPDAPIAVGQPAPSFSLVAHTGRSPLSLADLRGQVVVLAFYVLDFTGTCRSQLRSLQENLSR
jgi:peroxiredoxin